MSSIRRHSPSGGDGMHLKGDFHEVYHNLGIDAASDISVPVGAGGNANSVTRNNVAQELFDFPLPGTASNNYAGQKNPKRVRELLRDSDNWDFRPRADAKELIDQGTPVACSVKGQSIDVSAGFKGRAPDIGAYEVGDAYYWIPGRQEAGASMPIPRDGGEDVKLDADLMFLIGHGGANARIHLGTSRDELKLVGELAIPANIVGLSGENALRQGTTYYWRVDTERADGSLVEGPVWSFTTGPN